MLRRALCIAAVSACGGTDGEERLTPPGLCSDWGASGRFDHDFGIDDGVATSLVIAEDGSAVLAGSKMYFGHDGNASALVWLTSTGELADVKLFDIAPGRFDAFGQVLRRPDGGLLVGGSYDGGTTARSYAIRAVTATGEPDDTWCSPPLVTDDGISPGQMHLAGERIYITSGSVQTTVRRYDRHCISDPTYGASGQYDTVYFDALDVLSDGSTVLLGRTEAGHAMRRLTADGDQDSTFAGGGTLVLPFELDTFQHRLARYDDGSWLAVAKTNDPFLELARVNAAGVLDTSFGTAGVVRLSPPGDTIVTDIVIGPSGAITLFGASLTTQRATAFRLAPDGSLDTSFGTDGVLELEQGGFGQARRLPDERILAVGSTRSGLMAACLE